MHIELLIVILGIYLVTGCASVSDIQKLQSQLNTLEIQVSKITIFVAISKELSEKSHTKAAHAEKTANLLGMKLRDISNRIDYSIPRVCR